MHTPPHVTGLQHPPTWRDSESLRDKPRARDERLRRNWAVGSNPLYEYARGINFVMLSGKVVREPRVSGAKGMEFTWFRMCTPNQDNPRQRLFITVRTHGEAGAHVWENVALGDEVAVTGRIYSMRMMKPGMHPKQFVCLIAERVSSSYPLQLDTDARFVRVRVDLWNRMTSFIGQLEEHKVPERQKLELLRQFKKIMGIEDTIADEVDSDQLDPDPSSNKDHDDATSDDRDDVGGRG